MKKKKKRQVRAADYLKDDIRNFLSIKAFNVSFDILGFIASYEWENFVEITRENQRISSFRLTVDK